MTTPRRLIAGGLSLLTLLTLLVGVPLALAMLVGWPLPHAWPSVTQLRTLLETSGIPDVVLVDALAVVCWIAWMDFALATIVEVVSAAEGRPAPRVLVIRPWQPVVGRLVTTVVIAVAALGARPQADAAAHPAPLAVALAARHGGALVSAEGVVDGADAGSGIRADAPARQANDYVVRRGDTLWGISGQRLGNPRRWPEVWRRNEGRSEPGRRRFTDPNLIVPGWRLDVAVPTPIPSVSPPPPDLSRAPHRPPASEKTPPALGKPPAVPIPAPAANAGPAAGTEGASTSASPRPATSRVQDPAGVGVTLAEGGFVALSFATGVLAGLAAARANERRRWRIGSSHGVGVCALEGATVRSMRSAVRAAPPADGAATDVPPSGMALPPPLAPPSLGLGPCAQPAAHVDVFALNGAALDGTGAYGAARSLIAAAVTADWRQSVEVLLVGAAERYLGGVRDLAGVDVVPDVAGALARITEELSRRERVLGDRGAEDHRDLVASPDPLGVLVVVVDGAELRGTTGAASLRRAADRCGRVGIALVVVGRVAGFAVVDVGADGSLRSAPPAIAAGVGRLFHLSPGEAREILAVAAAARGGAVQAPEGAVADSAALAGETSEPIGASPRRSGGAPARVLIRLFGPPRVEVDGMEVTSGLREKARELLALLALRPAGLRLEEALAEMWAEDEDRHVDTFRVAVTATRRRLRDVTGQAGGRFIVFAGERYRLDGDLVDSDARRLEESLAAAAHAASDAERVAALESVESFLGGPPLSGAAYEWAEPVREQLRRRAITALADLASLRATAGDEAGALAALERAHDVDPDSEDVGRRLMRRLAVAGDEDMALRVYAELERRAAMLGMEPEEETEDLMVELRGRRHAPQGEGDPLPVMAARSTCHGPNGGGSHEGRPRAQPSLPILEPDEEA